MNGLLCSFCGKSESDGVRIVAGPCVYICEECVEVCVEILRSTKIEVRDVLEEERRARAEQERRKRAEE